VLSEEKISILPNELGLVIELDEVVLSFGV
jgi:hypothetical protein